MAWLAISQLVLLGLVLYMFWRMREMKKRQDALIIGLEGKRYWRINMARPPFFKRWLRIMPFEAKGVLIDEGDQLRIRGFWLKNAKAFDVLQEKSQCHVEWLGNKSLRAGNLYWGSLVTSRWTLLWCADTGMYALPSREALADIFRSVFPKFPLDASKTKDFALEKNPRSLGVAMLFLALLLFALLDSFVFNAHELIESQLTHIIGGPFILLGGALAAAGLGVLLYVMLSRGRVPARESLVLSTMLTLAVIGAAIPLAKRVDQILASQPAQLYAYRMGVVAQMRPAASGRLA